MKFFNNQYIINQLKAIDENAYKKDLRIEAMLLFDQDDKDLANVRFSHLILKEQDQEQSRILTEALNERKEQMQPSR